MKTILLVSLVALMALNSRAATNYPPLTASELLDKFAAAQEPIKSFIAVEEVAGREEGVLPVAWGGRFGATNEVRLQGNLVCSRAWSWGPHGGTQRKPEYRSSLTDGERVLYYRPENPRDPAVWAQQVLRHQVPIEALDNGTGLKMCFGVLAGGGRFDLKLRREPKLKVRDQLELAGWVPSPCYVLDAETAVGHYTIWLDPACGYQIAKSLFRCGTGYLRPNGQPFEQRTSELWTIEKVRWGQTNNVWVPLEETLGFDEISTYTGWAHARRTTNVRLTRFVLDPDHSALRSFAPDDIREGTKVMLDPRTHGEGTWQRGCIVDKAGNVVFDGVLKNTSTGKQTPTGKR